MTVTTCVLTMIAVDTTIDTLTASVPFVTDEEAVDDASAGIEDVDVVADDAGVRVDDKEEFAVPEVVVHPPEPVLAVTEAAGAGVPTNASGRPLGALGVAVGWTPAKFGVGTVPLTVAVGRPSGYESSKISSCAPFRKLYRFV